MGDYWTDNGIIKPQQIVVCAANRFKDVILSGARHFDSVMRNQIEHMKEDSKPSAKGERWEQGFINQFGEFLTREEALVVVKESGQSFNADRNGSSTELFSEGLY